MDFDFSNLDTSQWVVLAIAAFLLFFQKSPVAEGEGVWAWVMSLLKRDTAPKKISTSDDLTLITEAAKLLRKHDSPQAQEAAEKLLDCIKLVV